MAGRSAVAGDLVDLLDGDVDAIVAGIAELEVVAILVADRTADDAAEARDAVIGVDDEVAGLDLREELGAVGGATAEVAALLDEAEQLAVGGELDDPGGGGDGPALGEGALEE